MRWLKRYGYPSLAHEAIKHSSDIARLLDELRAVPAKTPEQYGLYVALSEIEEPVATLQRKIATGLRELFMDDTIAKWVVSDEDVVRAIKGYVARFFSVSGRRSFVTLWNDESPPQKIRIPISDEQASFFREKGSGVWYDFDHNLLMSAVIPGILFAAVHLRQWSDAGSLPKNVSDPQKWNWSDFHEAL
jgi:hypothetical protein